MMRLRGCPKCEGDVLLERDHYGWYEQCLQCGYLRDLKTVVDVRKDSAWLKVVGAARFS